MWEMKENSFKKSRMMNDYSKESIICKMFVKILVALSCILIQPSIHHYIGNLDECTLSKICNHTWIPTCGYNSVDSSYRLFLNECDLHEYNCENNKSYVESDVKICNEKCTQKDHAQIGTTPMPSTIPTTEVSTIITTEDTSTETPRITSTEEVTATTTDKTDTSTIFVAPPTIEKITEETKSNTPKTSETTREVTVPKTTNVTAPPKLPDDSNTSDDENTISEEITQSETVITTPKLKLDCYPKDCFIPTAWETTSVAETRDFVQILRERYGNGVTILRDTTHFPQKAVYARKSAFIPGRYTER